jgi:antitoxin component YwqK of YwqJK toxin-antitoxin module
MKMMNKRYNIILVVVTIVIIGLITLFFCFKNEKVNILTRYNPKTKEIYKMRYFIRNGDTIIQGKAIIYNEKGIKVAEGNFVNNVLKGNYISYFNNGNIKSILYKKDNKITEETTEYYPNGKVKRYIMFDPFGLEAFIARYDEKGNIKSCDGYPLMEIYQYPIAHKKQFNIKINQYLKVGSVLKHNYLIANIPNAKRSLKIENISIDSANVKRKIISKPATNIYVEEILTKKGKNTIRAIIQYVFNDNLTPVLNDTISFDVEVH